MVPTPAIRNLIRDAKIHQIYVAIQSDQRKPAMQTAQDTLSQKACGHIAAWFPRTFSVITAPGLPLVTFLDILGTQEEDKNFSFVILQTRRDVESGASPADAMRKHPKTFDPLFTTMIAP